MGREIKRVPLDFDWPIDKVWNGYVNPHYKPCPGEGTTCFSGQTAGARWLEKIMYFLMVCVDDINRKPIAGALYPHPYLDQFGCRVTTDKPPFKTVPPTAELEELIVRLGASEKPGLLGRGSSDAWAVQKRILEAAGLDPENWGRCPICEGECIDPAVKKEYDAWKETEPPTGEGWQVWETVSEGSPISPVFATPEGLIDYLVDGGDEWSRKQGEGGCSREAAENFVKGSGWVPSMTIVGGTLRSGIESAAVMKEKG